VQISNNLFLGIGLQVHRRTSVFGRMWSGAWSRSGGLLHLPQCGLATGGIVGLITGPRHAPTDLTVSRLARNRPTACDEVVSKAVKKVGNLPAGLPRGVGI